MLPKSLHRLEALTQLNVTVTDSTALLEMNCPPVNVLSRTLSDELTSALDIISEVDEVRSVVLTGAGKVFCAGADMKGRKDVIKGPGDLSAHSRRTRECSTRSANVASLSWPLSTVLPSVRGWQWWLRATLSSCRKQPHLGFRRSMSG